MRGWTFLGAVLAVTACGANDGPGTDTDPVPADTAASAGMIADTASMAANGATAELRDTQGNVVGNARFSAADGGVQVQLEVMNLPAGTHGVHIHETGQCDAGGETPFESAGGHLNPDARQHGIENPNGPHAGDLPNVDVGDDGRGTLDGTAARGSGDALALLLDTDGSAIVVHADRDDQVTDDGPDGPGNSGARIACGVIRR